MAFQIQITVDSIEEAERVLACLRHDNPPVAQQVADQVTGAADNLPVEPKKRGRPAKNKAEPETPAATESAAPESEAAGPLGGQGESAEPAQQTPPTFDDAKAALQALLARHDGDMTVPLQVLASFDAQRISAVKEADWPTFIAKCQVN